MFRPYSRFTSYKFTMEQFFQTRKWTDLHSKPRSNAARGGNLELDK